MHAILYASRALIGTNPDAFSAIADKATVRNDAAGVTGALLFTGTHFAQLLEGPAAAIDTVFTRIMRDARHCDLRLLCRSSATYPRFDRWRSLPRDGSTYARGMVERAWWAGADACDGEARMLIRLLQALAVAPPLRQVAA